MDRKNTTDVITSPFETYGSNSGPRIPFVCMRMISKITPAITTHKTRNCGSFESFCHANVITQVNAAIPKTIRDRLCRKMETSIPDRRMALRLQYFPEERELLFWIERYAALNTNGMSARLAKAGYLPQSTAWAGMYQPKAASMTAKIPALLDRVACLTIKNMGNGMTARMI